MISLLDVCAISASPADAVLSARRDDGWQFDEPSFPCETFLAPTALCGDAPNLYHPTYIAAILSGTNEELKSAQLPTIDFSTDEATRRSMTLNAMRMSVEFRQSGSRRVLELVENRLAANQNSSVHDVLVYLMNAVWDARREIREAQTLRADSLGAWLKLDSKQIEEIWRTSESASALAASLQKIETTPRANLAAIIENQWELLHDDIAPLREIESETFELIKEIRARLGTVEFDRTPLQN